MKEYTKLNQHKKFIAKSYIGYACFEDGYFNYSYTDGILIFKKRKDAKHYMQDVRKVKVIEL
jgi:hypothetical protein